MFGRTLTTRKGFTLIELLVVIAIIAILAAILFPVFTRVKAKAHQNTCLSNIKQVGFAALMYAADYDDVIAPGRTGQGWCAWTAVIAPWGDAATIEVYPGCGTLGPYLADPTVAVCPDWRQDMNPASVAASAKIRYLSYGNNDLIPGRAVSSVLLPTQMILVAENYNDSGSTSIWYAPYGPSRYRPAFRHHTAGTGFLAAFLDGHVKMCPSGEYWGPNSAKFWDPDQQKVEQWPA